MEFNNQAARESVPAGLFAGKYARTSRETVMLNPGLMWELLVQMPAHLTEQVGAQNKIVANCLAQGGVALTEPYETRNGPYFLAAMTMKSAEAFAKSTDHAHVSVSHPLQAFTCKGGVLQRVHSSARALPETDSIPVGPARKPELV